MKPTTLFTCPALPGSTKKQNLMEHPWRTLHHELVDLTIDVDLPSWPAHDQKSSFVMLSSKDLLSSNFTCMTIWQAMKMVFCNKVDVHLPDLKEELKDTQRPPLHLLSLFQGYRVHTETVVGVSLVLRHKIVGCHFWVLEGPLSLVTSFLVLLLSLCTCIVQNAYECVLRMIQVWAETIQFL